MTDDKTNFGNYLKYLREDYGHTLDELAGTIGYSSAYLSQIEKGRKPAPGVEMLKQLSEALKAPYSGLLKKAGYKELGEGQYYKELYSDLQLEKSENEITSGDLNYSIDLHFDSILDWLKDKRLSERDRNYLKSHFNELLLRYKEIIKELTNANDKWILLENSSIKIYGNEITIEEVKDAYIKKELEKTINDTSNWIYTIKNSL